jgi:hypothetical protein
MEYMPREICRLTELDWIELEVERIVAERVEEVLVTV